MARVEQLEALVARLQETIQDLEARLKQDSTNSSRPPSSDPPGTVRQKKPPRGKKRGGQPGHRGVSRCLLPPEQVDRTVECVPSTCQHCGEALPEAPASSDPAPWRHQVVEVPPICPTVTEYRRHARTCSACGQRTWASLPAGVSTRRVGPRLQAVVALLSGACRLSRRSVQALLRDLFGVQLSLGTLLSLEAATACALEVPYRQVATALARAPALHVDETGWKAAGQRCWLWTATAGELALFRLDRSRSQDACDALLTAEGEVQGKPTVVSDRYSGYAHLPLSQRALCWAHLARDFRALAERQGVSATVGRWALDVIGELFGHWRRCKAGELDRQALQAAVAPLQEQFRTLVRWGAEGGCRKAKALCRDLLKHWEALWTWVHQEGVEPTNNAAERSLRPAVLWRKGSFGHQGESGKLFVERLLTTVTSLRLQQRNVWLYLEAACQAAPTHATPPSLLPAAST